MAPRCVCEGGVSCTGNRDLHDDFGVAVSPIDAASIVYSDDQYDGFRCNPPPAGRTATTNDQPSCDHTNAATGSSNTLNAGFVSNGSASSPVSIQPRAITLEVCGISFDPRAAAL